MDSFAKPPAIIPPSTVLNSASAVSAHHSMAGFASLLNLKDGCPVTRGRRIQISKLEVPNPRTEVGSSGHAVKKRWSFHSSNQINQLLMEDRVIKPISSPKRRKSCSTGLLLNRHDSATSTLSEEIRITRKSDDHSSKRVLSSLHQQQSSQSQHRHHRTKLLPIRNECDASSSRSRQRLMEEYFVHTDSYPLSYQRLCLERKYSREPPPPDHISNMPDEVLLRIFKYLPKPSLASLSRTCHRFNGLIEDETLWKRLCVMGRLMSQEHLLIIMTRKPIYLRMSRASIPDPEDFPTDLSLLISGSQLRYLDLSSAAVTPSTLSLIMKISPNLVKLSLEHLTVSTDVIKSMACASTIEAINLTMCYELDCQALIDFLSKCQSLKELNMGCIKCEWSKEEISEIVAALPETLQQLNFSGFRNTLNDCHVSTIVTRCPQLVELDVSDSQEIQSKSIEHMLKLKHLQHLGLSRCYGIDPPSYSMLSGSKHLKYLDLFSLFKENSLRQLSITLPGIEINKFPFSAIARPTVGNKRSSIWLQRVRD